MNTFAQWDVKHNTNRALIDAQHQALLEKIKHCMEAAVKGSPKALLISLLDDIKSSLETHFTHEEQLLNGLDHASIAHFSKHSYVLEHLAETIEKLKSNSEEKALTIHHVLHTLHSWYMDHLETEDKALFLPAGS
jgi:hemerythrin-like metal-binding protein